MSRERGVYFGPRLRRLRRELGITQAEMASDLAISPSYVALMERNTRPVTAEMLLRIARTYRLALDDLAPDDRDDHQARLGTVLRDPIFADCDVDPLEATDVVANFPGIADALLRLHAAYRASESVLADHRAGEGGSEDAATRDPSVEARAFIAAHRNHFARLDAACEALAGEIGEGGIGADRIERRLAERHNIRVRALPASVMIDSARRFDRHHDQLLIDDTLDAPSRAFQLAIQLAYLECDADIADAMAGAALSSDNARALVRRALASYAAAAILMPYGAFAEAADKARYDIDVLARRFGTSFEQSAHRLTTLQRPGREGVPFFFVRIDPAGNVSKRLDGAGFPFARHGGSCPLWSIHDAFRDAGRIVTQWLELPDGQRFFSIARTVTSGGGTYGAPRMTRAIALCCAHDHAAKLVYADGENAEPTPIGVTCRLCQRPACIARAAPPIGRTLLADDYRRSTAPFTMSEG